VVEQKLGLPVLSAAVATTYSLLRALDLEPKVPDAGALLSGVRR
jgi:maleate isomerase